jgi:DNA-binding winged helix-turn-helix (wHTH) protein/Tol biopolymer transport system component
MGNRAARVLNSEPVGKRNGSGVESARTLRFGVFELNLRVGELRRNGIKIKLQEQPFQVLSQLLERPGDVVTREELRDRLWPADTFVDFDHGLNAAIRRLRDALGDSAENPTFVETVARRGYRFLAPVSMQPTNGAGPEQVSTEAEPVTHPLRHRVGWIGASVAGVVLVLFGITLGMFLARDHPSSLPIRISQLTANPADDRVRAAAISRDGKYLAFSDETGFYLRQVDTGETHFLTLPEGLRAVGISWFPDSVHMVLALTGHGEESSLWIVSALGGTARTLNDDGRFPAVSPDGKEVAFVAGKKMRQEVRLVDSDGAQPRKLVGEEGDFFGAVAWSPDGTKIAYTRGRFAYAYGVKGAIEVLDVRNQRVSSEPVRVSTWVFAGLDGPLAWISDGRLIYAATDPPPHPPGSSLWSMLLNPQGQPIGPAVRLTNESGGVFSISASSDANRIAYVKGIPQPDVYVATPDPEGNISEPQRLTLDDRQDIPFDWTPDNKAVIFISDRTGRFSVYKQAVDQTVPEMLVRGEESPVQARLSPDGAQLLYLVYPNSPESRTMSPLMLVPLAGGTPRKIVEANWITNHQCARAPATVCLYSVMANGSLTFFTFDPIKGKGSQVFQIKDDLPKLYNWSLSPDGTTLALAKGKWGDEEPRIHLVRLNGDPERWFTVQGWPGLASLDWAADSRTLWAASSGEEENALLNIDLKGHARAVWRPSKKSVGWAIPSRDGRHLALYVGSSSANVWMLERP